MNSSPEDLQEELKQLEKRRKEILELLGISEKGQKCRSGKLCTLQVGIKALLKRYTTGLSTKQLHEKLKTELGYETTLDSVKGICRALHKKNEVYTASLFSNRVVYLMGENKHERDTDRNSEQTQG